MIENRIEKKFTYKEHDENFNFFILDALFKKIYQTRVVNSIYFDTFSSNNVWDNINGYSNRKKIRVRWYNKISDTDVFIELKKKNNFVTQKQVDKIGKFNSYKDLCLFLQSDNFLNHKFIAESKINLVKTIQNQYERQYYISTNNKLRITVDRKLKIYYGDFTKFDLDDTIVEFKYDVDNSNYVNELIYKYHLKDRNKKYSKYVNSFLIFNDSGLV